MIDPDKMKEGNIEVEVKEDHRGNILNYEYTWKGGKKIRLPFYMIKEYTGLDYTDLKTGEEIRIGPYKLIIYDTKRIGDFVYAYRAKGTVFDGTSLLNYKISQFFEHIYRKFIVTLAVWGLAEYHVSEIPTIEDVYLFQKLFGEK